MPKAFRDLTAEEARLLLREIVEGSGSESDLRSSMSRAGFDVGSSRISCQGSGPGFVAEVFTVGPRGEQIIYS